MMGAPRYWTHDRVLAAIRSWAHARQGVAPRKDDWQHARPEHPSARTVVERFGTWNAAIAAAGLQQRRRFGRHPQRAAA